MYIVVSLLVCGNKLDTKNFLAWIIDVVIDDVHHKDFDNLFIHCNDNYYTLQEALF